MKKQKSQWCVEKSNVTGEIYLKEKRISKKLDDKAVIVFNKGYYEAIDVDTGLLIQIGKTRKECEEKFNSDFIQSKLVSCRLASEYWNRVSTFEKLLESGRKEYLEN